MIASMSRLISYSSSFATPEKINRRDQRGGLPLQRGPIRYDRENQKPGLYTQGQRRVVKSTVRRKKTCWGLTTGGSIEQRKTFTIPGQGGEEEGDQETGLGEKRATIYANKPDLKKAHEKPALFLEGGDA